MKFLPVLAGSFLSLTAMAQSRPVADSTKPVQVVEAACGQCMFGMKDKGCSLAVRIDGRPYFVDGTGIDDHGDAHAKDGFCNSVRKASVQGAIVDGRFRSTYFVLRALIN